MLWLPLSGKFVNKANYLSVVTGDVSQALAPPSALIIGDVCDDNISCTWDFIFSFLVLFSGYVTVSRYSKDRYSFVHGSENVYTSTPGIQHGCSQYIIFKPRPC